MKQRIDKNIESLVSWLGNGPSALIVYGYQTRDESMGTRQEKSLWVPDKRGVCGY
uniref:Uncharacterized protein n=1 Tax=Arion vulgaris TaxID=1028688 RepID=A0A0B6Y3W8_9EUPU